MGNWLYREWCQIEQYDEFAALQNSKQKCTIKPKKQSVPGPTDDLTENLTEITKPRQILNTNTPITNKVVVADFDPRSPSSGIQRTPICYLNEPNDKKKHPMVDPRSPTSEYNRTPIHCPTNPKSIIYKNNDNLNSSLFNDSISSNISEDVSLVMQQVPDNAQTGVTESPTSKQIKQAKNSCNPSHILQRKQVQKLNQNKLFDQDKENQL